MEHMAKASNMSATKYIRSLIEQVQQTVYDSAGVRLEREVIYLGEF